MARTKNGVEIYKAARLFEERCLVQDDSLLFDEEHKIWTVENLKALHQELEGGKSLKAENGDENAAANFLAKYEKQVRPRGREAAILAAELLYVYFLFPGNSNISGPTKTAQVTKVLSWGKVSPPEDGSFFAFKNGLGGTGRSYNSRRPNELMFFCDFVIKLKEDRSTEARRALVRSPGDLQSFMDELLDGGKRSLRHVLLHLLHPDDFERIASGGNKEAIRNAFAGLIDRGGDMNTDAALLQIRGHLNKLLQQPDLDFYERPLAEAWYRGADDESGIDLQDILYKKQLIFYGPPGTGKTHAAKGLAEQIIRHHVIKKRGAANYFQSLREVKEQTEARIHRLQMHAGYGYEEFIRALHIVNNNTVYRNGELLRIIEDIEGDREGLPHVLILDEINRTNLSRMLGECFTLLENRGDTINLPGGNQDGTPKPLRIPDNLFIIGTMNLIDQSIDTLDFALRRRFLWQHCSFDDAQFMAAAKYRWGDRDPQWEAVEEQFQLLARAAESLNEKIHQHPVLGPEYEVGHTYLLDAIAFLGPQDLARKKRDIFWRDNTTKEAGPAVEKLWRLSIRPLLAEYLSSVELKERKQLLADLGSRFFAFPDRAE